MESKNARVEETVGEIRREKGALLAYILTMAAGFYFGPVGASFGSLLSAGFCPVVRKKRPILGIVLATLSATIFLGAPILPSDNEVAKAEKRAFEKAQKEIAGGKTKAEVSENYFYFKKWGWSSVSGKKTVALEFVRRSGPLNFIYVTQKSVDGGKPETSIFLQTDDGRIITPEGRMPSPERKSPAPN